MGVSTGHYCDCCEAGDRARLEDLGIPCDGCGDKFTAYDLEKLFDNGGTLELCPGCTAKRLRTVRTMGLAS